MEELSMKKRHYILLLLLLCVVFTACGKGRTDLPSAALKAEMQAAWLQQTGRELPWDGATGCYGIYDGAVVYLSEGQADMIDEKMVAGYKFAWPSTFTIRVYKAGEFLTLEEAYEAGILTEKQVGEIAKYHDEYLSVRTNWGDWRPWKDE